MVRYTSVPIVVGLAITAIMVSLSGTGFTSRADNRQEAIDRDLKALQGRWVVTAAFKDGKEVPEADRKKERSALLESITIKDNKYAIAVSFPAGNGTGRVVMGPEGKPEDFRFRFSLDPRGTVGIVEFETTRTWGSNAPVVKAYARYRIQGDVLYICKCASQADDVDPKKMPDSVETKPGDGYYLFVLKKSTN